MGEYLKATHDFPPVCDRDCKILILGSFPSVKSREQNFYYGHPQNRFWKVIAGLTGYPLPRSVEEKRGMLLENHIAVWDVIAECEIIGSSDSSIRNVVPADLGRLLQTAGIRRIYANGTTAGKMFNRFQKDVCGREITILPSTSPANAAYSLERLQEAWRCILTGIRQENESEK